MSKEVELARLGVASQQSQAIDDIEPKIGDIDLSNSEVAVNTQDIEDKLDDVQENQTGGTQKTQICDTTPTNVVGTEEIIEDKRGMLAASVPFKVRRNAGAIADWLNIYSPSSDLMVWLIKGWDDGIDGSLPQFCVGRGMDVRRNYGSLDIFPGATYYTTVENVHAADKIMGVFQHNFTDAVPGEITFEQSNDPTFSDSGTYPTVYQEKVDLKTANPRVTFNIQRIATYFRFKVKNNGAVWVNVNSYAINVGV